MIADSWGEEAFHRPGRPDLSGRAGARDAPQPRTAVSHCETDPMGYNQKPTNLVQIGGFCFVTTGRSLTQRTKQRSRGPGWRLHAPSRAASILLYTFFEYSGELGLLNLLEAAPRVYGRRGAIFLGGIGLPRLWPRRAPSSC